MENPEQDNSNVVCYFSVLHYKRGTKPTFVYYQVELSPNQELVEQPIISFPADMRKTHVHFSGRWREIFVPRKGKVKFSLEKPSFVKQLGTPLIFFSAAVEFAGFPDMDQTSPSWKGVENSHPYRLKVGTNDSDKSIQFPILEEQYQTYLGRGYKPEVWKTV